MGNGTEILVSELQKQNQFLQIAVQISEEKTKHLEESKKHLEEQNKYLQFQLDQLKRMLLGAKRERFVSNADVNQMTLPFDIPEETANQPELEKVEYIRTKPSRENHHGRLELPSHLPVEEVVIEPKESTKGLKCIGQEITSTLDYAPAKLFVRNISATNMLCPMDREY